MRTLRFAIVMTCILGLGLPGLGLADQAVEAEKGSASEDGKAKEDGPAKKDEPVKKDEAAKKDADKPLKPVPAADTAPLTPPKPMAMPKPAPADDALPPPPPGFAEVDMDEAAPVKPPLNLLDLHGYLRLRGDLMNGLDLGLRSRLSGDENGPGTARGAAYPQFPRSATGKEDTLAGANMRFRLEPTINISEDVRINVQIDMLDNLVLGSTPDGYPKSLYYPMVAFSQGQQPPVEGVNSIKDSILIKRVWGEVMTPVGLLRFGRMGSEWGMGLLANDGGPMHVDNGPLRTRRDPFSPTGQCFDCDYGSTADRIMFITKVFGHYIVPMIDFTSEGPLTSYSNEWGGQQADFEQLDDVNSYILAIAKRDKPEDIQQTLAQGDWSLNYGVYFVFRNQAYDAIDFSLQGPYDGRDQVVTNYAVRNMEAYIPDVWVRFMMGKLRIEAEFVAIIGKVGYDAQSGSLDGDGNLIDIDEIKGQSLDMMQWGGTIQADYSFMDDELLVGLEFGVASGDDSPGFGVRPYDENHFENRQGDHDINNFRFHPDYHVDLILWRQIIGTVTDAMYIKPSIQYEIAEGFGAKASIIYSSAMESSSTRGKSSPLGLEFDFDFFYFSDDNFHAGLSYGLLIPFDGMGDLGDDELPGGVLAADADDDAEIAHRVMGRLVLFF
jgi:uncharacterized protein (TIGR04551 family)